jgi:hypothetical protein
VVEAAEARADLPVPVVPAAARLLRADLPEADLPEVADQVVLLELVLEEVPAERLVVPEALEAAAARTRSSIPRMAKFPIRWKLARNPTT